MNDALHSRCSSGRVLPRYATLFSDRASLHCNQASNSSLFDAIMPPTNPPANSAPIDLPELDLSEPDPPFDPKGAIDIKIHHLSQLFNSYDPSPFLEKDLDDDAEEYIVAWARELPSSVPLNLVIHTTEDTAVRSDPKVLRASVRKFFQSRHASKKREFSHLMAQGRKSLGISLVLLTFCQAFRSILDQYVVQRTTDPLYLIMLSWVTESLLIGAWAGFWSPVQIYVFKWWPVAGWIRLYARLSRVGLRMKTRETNYRALASHPRILAPATATAASDLLAAGHLPYASAPDFTRPLRPVGTPILGRNGREVEGPERGGAVDELMSLTSTDGGLGEAAFAPPPRGPPPPFGRQLSTQGPTPPPPASRLQPQSRGGLPPVPQPNPLYTTLGAAAPASPPTDSSSSPVPEDEPRALYRHPQQTPPPPHPPTWPTQIYRSPQAYQLPLPPVRIRTAGGGAAARTSPMSRLAVHGHMAPGYPETPIRQTLSPPPATPPGTAAAPPEGSPAPGIANITPPTGGTGDVATAAAGPGQEEPTLTVLPSRPISDAPDLHQEQQQQQQQPLAPMPVAPFLRSSSMGSFDGGGGGDALMRFTSASPEAAAGGWSRTGSRHAPPVYYAPSRPTPPAPEVIPRAQPQRAEDWGGQPPQRTPATDVGGGGGGGALGRPGGPADVVPPTASRPLLDALRHGAALGPPVMVASTGVITAAPGVVATTTTTTTRPVVAIAAHGYTATPGADPPELSFRRGDRIEGREKTTIVARCLVLWFPISSHTPILLKSPSRVQILRQDATGWWVGRPQGQPAGATGWFPSGFVRLPVSHLNDGLVPIHTVVPPASRESDSERVPAKPKIDRKPSHIVPVPTAVQPSQN
ncbi:hypothetical protein PAPYR_10013 [Paratrimastix pyriformis]|uniref:SH3 domain-containing protein n=1 Tax=Paratrimastix pyriformis TaxID=342808 RepID=A0ABQ8U6Z3_9EUKA|nr:hypothetical protein PAPYR_10013 [Paratrimastix pyriformis]